MKIVYHHRIASKDGQYVHVEELIKALAARGHDLRLTGPAFAEVSDFGGESRLIDRLKRYVPKIVYELMEVGYNLIAYRRLAKACREHGTNVIYERYNLHLLAGALHRHWHGGRLLVEVNAPLTLERGQNEGLALPAIARWSDRFIWRRADAVFTVTQVLAEHVQAAGVSSERIIVTPNGIDLDRFESAPDKIAAKKALGLEDRTVIGFTGFMRAWHGLEKIVDWLAASNRQDTVFLMVGDGPARAEIEARAADLGVAERTCCTGVVARHAIPAYIAAFDIALQPAVVPYASPLKLFEYMAMSHPIIAPNSANIREILTHEHDALLAEPDSVDVMLNRMLADPVHAATLGKNAWGTLLERGLTWAHNAERVETALSA